jgi:hypothetical protein
MSILPDISVGDGSLTRAAYSLPGPLIVDTKHMAQIDDVVRTAKLLRGKAS